MGHLIPFINGLIHLGRPTKVFFPTELIEQGVSVLLTGLNNTMAVQSNPSWVWPYWIERQTDPDAREFMPTGLNLIKSNLSHRNWTSLGVDGSRREGMLDPVGMLTLQAYGWSVFPYVRMDGETFLPPRMDGKVSQSLLENDLPCVITRYEASPKIYWESESIAVRIWFDDFIYQTHRIENRTDKVLPVTLGLTVRPYNPLTVGHINQIRFKKRTWKVNGLPGILFLQKPHSITAADRHMGDPLFAENYLSATDRLSSKSGIACGLSEYYFELAPGEEKTVQTLGYLNPGAIQWRRPKKKVLALEAAPAREKTLDYFRTHRKTGLCVGLPDAAVERLFYSVKNHLHVFDDVTHFAPGSFLYHAHWFRDACFISMTFDNLGYFEKVLPKLESYPRRQKSDGFFRSHTGEWDSNGEAIFTLVRHARLSGNAAFLKKVYPSIRHGVKWIVRTRSESKQESRSKKERVAHHGLLPAGFSAEHFGPNDHYFWDNFWCLAGIREALWAARFLKIDRDVRYYEKEFVEYQTDLHQAMNLALEKSRSNILPSSPYRKPDSACIGNMAAASPLSIVPLDTPWLEATANYLYEKNLRHGLFFQKIIHTGLNPYLSVQLARVLLQKEDPRFYAILERLTALATSTGTWPEAIHPKLTGGCMGDGDHGWSAAEFINLIREMFVWENGTELVLGQGIPPQWMESGKPIWIDLAPTLWGMVSFRLTPKTPGKWEMGWLFRAHRNKDFGGDRANLVLSLPPVKKGGPRQRIALGEHEGHVDINWVKVDG